LHLIALTRTIEDAQDRQIEEAIRSHDEVEEAKPLVGRDGIKPEADSHEVTSDRMAGTPSMTVDDIAGP